MKRFLKHMVGMMAAMATALTVGLSAQIASAQSTWDAIKERGTMRIGVTQAPPWFTKDIRTGEWTGGLGISIGKAMAEVLEVELEPVEVTWGTAIAALQSQPASQAAAGLAHSAPMDVEPKPEPEPEPTLTRTRTRILSLTLVQPEPKPEP